MQLMRMIARQTGRKLPFPLRKRPFNGRRAGLSLLLNLSSRRSAKKAANPKIWDRLWQSALRDLRGDDPIGPLGGGIGALHVEFAPLHAAYRASQSGANGFSSCFRSAYSNIFSRARSSLSFSSADKTGENFSKDG